MSQNHRPAAPAIDPTKKSSLFEVPTKDWFLGRANRAHFQATGSAGILRGTVRLSPVLPTDRPVSCFHHGEIRAFSYVERRIDTVLIQSPTFPAQVAGYRARLKVGGEGTGGYRSTFRM